MKVLSIDVTKLDKSRFKRVTKKDGTIAVFCDLVLFYNKNGTDAYGNDGMVKQGVSKEEREAKVEMPILGNWRSLNRPSQEPAKPTQPKPVAEVEEDDIPF